MFCSLPTIVPRDSYLLWYSSQTYPQRPPSPIQPAHSFDDPSRPVQHTNHAHEPIRTAHTELLMHESALATRKTNIRRFGAGWIKPPGITKTLQGLEDERLEREEAEEALRREEAVAEQERAAMELEARQAGWNDGDEHDLDADIPDADEILGELEGNRTVTGGFEFEGDLDEELPDEFDMERDLDEDVEDADDVFGISGEEDTDEDDEWQHTDSSADEDADGEPSMNMSTQYSIQEDEEAEHPETETPEVDRRDTQNFGSASVRYEMRDSINSNGDNSGLDMNNTGSPQLPARRIENTSDPTTPAVPRRRTRRRH